MPQTATKRVIELKAIKYSSFASHETACYEASLYFNGKKIGVVSNDGHGGCDDYQGDLKDYKEANQWCIDNLPKWKLGIRKDEVEQDTTLEIHCGTLLGIHLATKDYRKLIRGHVLFYIRPNKADVFQLKHKGLLDAAKTKILKDYPSAVILNDLAEHEAVNILRMQQQ